MPQNDNAAPLRFASVISMSLSASLLLAACQAPNPYLRDLKPDPSDPRRVTIERAYLDAMVHDLEACYATR